MLSKKHFRKYSFIRDTIIIVVLSILLFAFLEIIIRMTVPQNVTYTYIDGDSLAVEDSILGYVYRPNGQAKVEGPEFSFEYKINEYGMRDASFHPIPKPSNVMRILLLGDSFTFGDANDYDKTWPVIFENILLEKGYRVDIVKAGVSGYDTKKEALYLERLCPIYNPDIVVLTFLPNDLFTNKPIIDKQLINASQKTKQNDPAVISRDEEKHELHMVRLAKRFLLANDFLYTKLYLITPRSVYFTIPMNEKLRHQIELTKDLLLRVANYCKHREIQFMVLSLPQQVQVIMKAHDYKYNNINVDFMDELFLGFARENEFLWVPTLSVLSEKYQSDKTNLYFRLDGHLNNVGNHLVGKYLAKKFIELFESRLNVTDIRLNSTEK